MLGELNRTLNVKTAAKLQDGCIQVTAFDLHGLAAENSVMTVNESSPKACIFHEKLLFASLHVFRYNRSPCR